MTRFTTRPQTRCGGRFAIPILGDFWVADWEYLGTICVQFGNKGVQNNANRLITRHKLLAYLAMVLGLWCGDWW